MSSTALVPLGPCRPAASTGHTGEPAQPARAEFLTQLIAVRAQVPQMRLRRRAEPADAIAVYQAHRRAVLPTGLTLSRSL